MRGLPSAVAPSPGGQWRCPREAPVATTHAAVKFIGHLDRAGYEACHLALCALDCHRDSLARAVARVSEITVIGCTGSPPYHKVTCAAALSSTWLCSACAPEILQKFWLRQAASTFERVSAAWHVSVISNSLSLQRAPHPGRLVRCAALALWYSMRAFIGYTPVVSSATVADGCAVAGKDNLRDGVIPGALELNVLVLRCARRHYAIMGARVDVHVAPRCAKTHRPGRT